MINIQRIHIDCIYTRRNRNRNSIHAASNGKYHYYLENSSKDFATSMYNEDMEYIDLRKLDRSVKE